MTATAPEQDSRSAQISRQIQKLRARFKNLSPKQKYLAAVIGTVLIVLAGRFMYDMFWFESTDDAFLKGHVHIISARIPGTVKDVLVKDNERVKQGQELVQLDPRDYDVQVKIAQANYSKAHKDVSRFSAYLKDLGPTDKPVFDRYQANALVSDAELTKAQLQYEYTTIKAPADGKIGKRGVETGDHVLPGQALMALVEPNPWIVANFKEHQVTHLRVGQPVEIHVDAIPEKTFRGQVDSISPGAGSVFSLLPPDNATGNFTKIVQRIAVKIVFDSKSVAGFEDRLVPGMSAEVTVKVR